MRVSVCEVEVTDAWFVPHFLPREDKPYEMAMYHAWIRYMSYEGHFHCGWSAMIVSMLSEIPRALNERGSRVAFTFAVWLMTPVGNTFFETLFKEQQDASFFMGGAEGAEIRSWAYENRLSSCVMNRPVIQLLFTQVAFFVIFFFF